MFFKNEFIVSGDVLDEMIEYIELTEQGIEHEIGKCRSLHEVIDEKGMPDIYYTLIALKNK